MNIKTKTKEKKEKKVEIMPASIGVIPLDSFLSVEFKKNTKLAAYRDRGIYTFLLPDRTVHVGRSNSSGFGILFDRPDIVVPLSPISNPELLHSEGYRYVMVNPKEYKRVSKSKKRESRKIKIVSDSGGFQLANGVSSFIDPKELGEIYKDRIDYGMGLDIPLPLPLHSTEWMGRMAKVMAKNNKIIESIAKSTHVMDVSHGLSIEARSQFLKTVMKNQTSEYLALGGIGQSNYDTQLVSLITGVLNVCNTLYTARKQYSHFHILGTISPIFQVVYNLLLKQGIVKVITADSSTYAQRSLNYMATVVPYSSEVKIPQYYQIPSEPLGRNLPCNCEICNLSKYSIVYRLSQHASMNHNLIALKRKSDLLNSMTDQYLSGNLKIKEMLPELSTKSDIFPVFTRLIQFVSDMGLGYDKAFAKHSKFLPSVRKSKNSLFSRQILSNKVKDRVSKVIKVVEAYEKYHGI